MFLFFCFKMSIISVKIYVRNFIKFLGQNKLNLASLNMEMYPIVSKISDLIKTYSGKKNLMLIYIFNTS